MITYYTQSASHLAPLFSFPKGSHILTKFSDGEMLLEVGNISPDQEILVIGSTISPSDTIFELFLLLDALTRAGVTKINLLLLYFGYARHAQPKQGQANAAQLICQMLGQFPLKTIQIMHPHNPALLEQWLPYGNIIPLEFFTSVAQNYDALVAPDNGAASLVKTIAELCDKEMIFLHKSRSHEQITINATTPDVAGKKLLIVDDILATGATITQTAQFLAYCGAQEIAAAVTHGLFSGNASEKISASPISKMYVTNTIAQTPRNKVEVYDISHLLRGFFLPSGPS